MFRLARTPARYTAWARAMTLDAQALIGMVELSGLTGKGGGAFPTHKKMRLMREQAGERKVLVVNGSEHEPGSLKDRRLLAQHPQFVLEGALIMAHAVGATEIVVAINRAASSALQAFRDAIDDAGPELRGLTVQVNEVPDSYIVGEEPALLEVLEGRDALPRKKPPFPIEHGLHGLPTLIQNVETVAHLPLIVGEGAEAYRALGLTLCTLGDEFVHAGVHEVRQELRYTNFCMKLAEAFATAPASKRSRPVVLHRDSWCPTISTCCSTRASWKITARRSAVR
ncbi:hypothetical protein LJR029_000706 [Caballeronia sp. LjRoot29]